MFKPSPSLSPHAKPAERTPAVPQALRDLLPGGVRGSLKSQLLQSLPTDDYERIAAACDKVELTFGQVLHRAGEPCAAVYFPSSSVVSLLSGSTSAHSLEIGSIGAEGVVGVEQLLGVDASPFEMLVQGAGKALRMPVAAFRQHVADDGPFAMACKKYLYALTVQITQTAACNAQHWLDQRLARWLLLSQDRARSPQLQLTHQLLSRMLGVRRVGVTEAVGRFQRAGLIGARRGELTVLNRGGLEASACPCYASLRETYRQVLGEA